MKSPHMIPLSKRIFIGLHASQHLQAEVQEWSMPFQEKIPARWIKGKNLHVTLVPPWEEEDISSVIQKLETLKGSIGPIDVHFNTAQFGPTPNAPRLLWALGKTPEKIVSLSEKLRHIFPEHFEARKFKLHLTLARWKAENFASFSVQSLNASLRWKESFHEITLFESTLCSHGAEYHALCKIRL